MTDITKLLQHITTNDNIINKIYLLDDYVIDSKKNLVQNNIFPYCGYPSEDIINSTTFAENYVSNYIERNKDDINHEDYEKVKEKLTNKLQKEIDSNILIICIKYPLSSPAYYQFELKKNMVHSDLLYLYTIGYQLTYYIEESDDKDPGHIPGMFNRASSNGRFGIWGHDIEDLVYNGNSKLILFSTNDDTKRVYFEADCDS